MRARFWCAAGLLAAAIFAGCSESGEESLIRPCEGTLKGQCGSECESTADCPSGLYCSEEGCTADCTRAGNECPNGFVCTGNGLCREGTGGSFLPGGSGGSGADGGGGLGDACTDIDVPFDAVTPSVLLLVDQSGSMNDAFGNGTRWSVLYDALMNRMNGVVYTLRAEVRFGLMLYTSDDGFAGGACPMLEEVPLRLGNYVRIQNVYGSAVPADGGDTPTAEAIEAATTALTGFTEPGPKYVLLVTDGLPDNCEDADAHNAQSQAMSVAAAAAAASAGITLIPMGLSDDIATQGAGPGHLQDLANAGAGMTRGNAKYYVASDDPDELAQQFQQIIGNVRTCLFDLTGTVDPDQAHLGRVVLDGQPLDLDDPNGWTLKTPRQIEVLGDACDQIQSSASRLTVTFPCDSDAVVVDVR